MDKRIEKLAEITGRTASGVERYITSDNFSFADVVAFADWQSEQAFIAGADWNDALYIFVNQGIGVPVDFKTWLVNFKKEQENEKHT